MSRHGTGRESFLTDEQEQELSQHLEENLYQHSQDIQRYIEKKYKITNADTTEDCGNLRLSQSIG